MADLETLRPEVREAVAAIDGGNGVFVNSDDGIGSVKWQIIRAELLRLQSTESRANEWQLRAERAEAELAALKARIAEAPVGVPGYDAHPWMTIDDDVMPPEWEGKRVRLVVEE